MTKKGATRIGPGDNRVRPPKAATKLLPEAKWRHIRLPDVESALEGEDIVVLWGHYKYPESLPRNKAEGHLNFVWRHYKDSNLKKLLGPIHSAFELENFLKDRYGVGISTKRPRTNTTTTSGHPNVPSLPAAEAAAIGALPPVGNGAAEKKRHFSRQASGNYEKQQHQQQHQLSPAIRPSNGNGDIDKGMIRQSSKEMAGLLYIGAGLTEDQEIDTKEPAAENRSNGSGNEEDNTLDKPSVEVKKEEGEDKKQQQSAGVPAASMAAEQQQQQPGADISQQQHQSQQQVALSFAAALAAVGNASGGDNDATTTGDGAAAATAANPSPMLDPTTASFLAAAAANGMHMPPGLSFPGMLHPAWGTLLANPIAWQLAGAGAGGLPSSHNGNGTTDDSRTAAAVAGGSTIPSHIAAMFPGLQFPGAFGQLAALGGYSNMPSLHPSTVAAAAAAAAAAGIDPTGLVPGVSAPSAAPLLPPSPAAAAAAIAAAAAQEGAAIIANKSNSNNEGAGGKYSTGDRPGRPPSYDIMVRWCVNLKRCLWQRHVPLTIEEAIAMVNDPALCARPPALSEKSRVLVASTLRKRVLGIYKITWSQIATDADPGLHDEVVDPSVHVAAGIKLKRHGMEPARSPNNTNTTSNRPVVISTGANGAAVNGLVDAGSGGSQGLMLPPGVLATNNPNPHPSPDDMSAFAIASAAAAAAAATGGTNVTAAAAGGGGKIALKKEEDLASNPLGNNDPNKTTKSMFEAANAATTAAAATQVVFHQGDSNGRIATTTTTTAAALLPPSLPPMISSLDDMRNAMGLEIEVKELSPGTANVSMPPATVKDVLNLMQQQQYQEQQQQVQVAPVAAQNNTVPAPDEAIPTLTGGVPRELYTVDLPSLDSLEKALSNTNDELVGLNNPEATPAGGEDPKPAAVTAKEPFRTKFATVDPTDADGMFTAMCDLHHVAGISKQECAAICQLWLENALSENQKKQLFMYIKANITEEDLVADWVKSFIRKHGG
jgi:hypothetical protein